MANGETFHHYAGGAQNIATIVALIVGGWWTYSVFQQTKQTAAAEERSCERAIRVREGQGGSGTA
jgi:hypothetical protein